MRAQGHEKVILYPQSMPPKMMAVLERYQSEGFVELLPFSYPGTLPAGDPRWISLKKSQDAGLTRSD